MKIKPIIFLFFILQITILACNNNQDSGKVQSLSENPIDKTKQDFYLEKGKAVAAATFASLSGQLQKAIAEGGVPNALKYCNINAMPLVDSLSESHQASIRRTSLKVRNPKNKPSQLEDEVLNNYEKQMAGGTELTPFVQRIDPATVAFFAPIKVNDFCLQCHGKVAETLSQEHFEIINQLYVEDKAVGYTAGELRGMWSIKFKEN